MPETARLLITVHDGVFTISDSEGLLGKVWRRHRWFAQAPGEPWPINDFATRQKAIRYLVDQKAKWAADRA
jgi:hypothetical protein